MDWKKLKRIHFVGIKGIAMAALAVWAKEAGYNVTGSDVRDEFPSDDVLKKAHIPVRQFGKIPLCDLVIYTGAHNGCDNPEVRQAMQKDIPVLAHWIALGEVMQPYRQISVAGSHGKTTTSAMVATILSSAGYNPSWAIGCGEIRGLGLSGHFGRGNIFVAEADEYVTDPGHDMTPRFLWQKPDILMITNIEYDHPDAYASLKDVQAAFSALQSRAQMTIMLKDFQIQHIRFSHERTFFSLAFRGMYLGEFTLKVPGRHNVKNAGLAITACMELGVSHEKIVQGLLAFGGTKRRFELVGDVGKAMVYDDYAHHPTEIRATLAAAREWYPKNRMIAVFQPHTYSRTKALMSDFSNAFTDANIVILSDIYASARENDTLGISGKTLMEETAQHHLHVFYAPNYTSVEKFLSKTMQPEDVIIFMGAGDIYGWSRKFIQA